MTQYTYRVAFDQGKVCVESAPISSPQPGQILVETRCSLISAGTEIMNLRLGRKATPGYSNVGIVVEMGDTHIEGISIGDRVVSQGGHAERVLVRYNPHLVQRIPDGVSDEQATFTVLGSVALHGVRAANLALDEPVLILGQGIVGQLVLQFARLSGAGPIAVADYHQTRLDISIQNGADFTLNPTSEEIDTALERLLPNGPSVVFDCTANAAGIPTAIRLAGQKGRLIAVTSLREPVVIDSFPTFQRKELTIVGIHQPQTPEVETAYHKWTKERNRTYILRLLNEGKLRVDNLINLRMEGIRAPEAYAALQERPALSLGALLIWKTD